MENNDAIKNLKLDRETAKKELVETKDSVLQSKKLLIAMGRKLGYTDQEFLDLGISAEDLKVSFPQPEGASTTAPSPATTVIPKTEPVVTAPENTEGSLEDKKARYLELKKIHDDEIAAIRADFAQRRLAIEQEPDEIDEKEDPSEKEPPGFNIDDLPEGDVNRDLISLLGADTVKESTDAMQVFLEKEKGLEEKRGEELMKNKVYKRQFDSLANEPEALEFLKNNFTLVFKENLKSYEGYLNKAESPESKEYWQTAIKETGEAIEYLQKTNAFYDKELAELRKETGIEERTSTDNTDDSKDSVAKETNGEKFLVPGDAIKGPSELKEGEIVFVYHAKVEPNGPEKDKEKPLFEAIVESIDSTGEYVHLQTKGTGYAFIRYFNDKKFGGIYKSIEQDTTSQFNK